MVRDRVRVRVRARARALYLCLCMYCFTLAHLPPLHYSKPLFWLLLSSWLLYFGMCWMVMVMGGKQVSVSVRRSWSWGEPLSVSVVTCCCCFDLPAWGDREDLTWLWHRYTTVSLSLIVNFTRLSYSDLYSWQWQLMASIPIPLRSQEWFLRC